MLNITNIYYQHSHFIDFNKNIAITFISKFLEYGQLKIIKTNFIAN